jgi:hypothetical protein
MLRYFLAFNYFLCLIFIIIVCIFQDIVGEVVLVLLKDLHNPVGELRGACRLSLAFLSMVKGRMIVESEMVDVDKVCFDGNAIFLGGSLNCSYFPFIFSIADPQTVIDCCRRIIFTEDRPKVFFHCMEEFYSMCTNNFENRLIFIEAISSFLASRPSFVKNLIEYSSTKFSVITNDLVWIVQEIDASRLPSVNGFICKSSEFIHTAFIHVGLEMINSISEIFLKALLNIVAVLTLEYSDSLNQLRKFCLKVLGSVSKDDQSNILSRQVVELFVNDKSSSLVECIASIKSPTILLDIVRRGSTPVLFSACVKRFDEIGDRTIFKRYLPDSALFETFTFQLEILSSTIPECRESLNQSLLLSFFESESVVKKRGRDDISVSTSKAHGGKRQKFTSKLSGSSHIVGQSDVRNFADLESPSCRERLTSESLLSAVRALCLTESIKEVDLILRSVSCDVAVNFIEDLCFENGDETTENVMVSEIVIYLIGKYSSISEAFYNILFDNKLIPSMKTSTRFILINHFTVYASKQFLDVGMTLLKQNKGGFLMLFFLREFLKFKGDLICDLDEKFVDILSSIFMFLSSSVSDVCLESPIIEVIESIRKLLGQVIVLEKRYGCIWVKLFSENVFGLFSPELTSNISGNNSWKFAIMRHVVFCAFEKYPYVSIFKKLIILILFSPHLLYVFVY